MTVSSLFETLFPSAPILICAGCCTRICNATDLCFFDQGNRNVHLVVKIELKNQVAPAFHIVPETDSAKKRFVPFRIRCSYCNEPLGSDAAIGPRGASVFSFTVEKIAFFFLESELRELVSRRDVEWRCFQEKYAAWIQTRTIVSFFPGSGQAEHPKKRAIGSEEHHPIRFPTIGDFSDINPALLTRTRPRPYQVEIFLRAALSNSLIFLPTGCGKTLIAAMLISLMRVLNSNRIAVFIVAKIPLAFQQAQYLQSETGLDVAALCSRSKHEVYHKDIYAYDAVVVTAQLLLNLLQRGDIRLDRISCVIVDEVHNASGRSAITHFFEQHYEFISDQEKPLVCGLTASPVEAGDIAEKGVQRLAVLCSLLWADLNTAIVCASDLECYTKTVSMKQLVVEEDRRVSLLYSEISNSIFAAFDRYSKLFDVSDNISSGSFSSVASLLRFLEDTCQLNVVQAVVVAHLRQLHTAAEIIRVIGGADGSRCLLEVVQTMQLHFSAPWTMPEVSQIIEWNQQVLQLGSSSSRLAALENFLLDRQLYEGQQFLLKEPTKILIFVRERRTARWLCRRLQNNDLITQLWGPKVVVGQGGAPDGMDWRTEQRPALDAFRSGTCRLLVATNVLQEGIDVPSCDCIIHFDPIANATQLIQSRGRARCSASQFLLICTKSDIDSITHILQSERLSRTIIEKAMYDSLKLQTPEETISFVSCLSELLSDIQETPADCPIYFADKKLECLAQQDTLCLIQRLQILCYEHSENSMQALEKSLRAIIALSGEVDFALTNCPIVKGRSAFDIECLIPELDEKEQTDLFCRIFGSLQRDLSATGCAIRRRCQTNALPCNSFQQRFHCMQLGNALSVNQFVSFASISCESLFWVSYVRKSFRLLIRDDLNQAIICLEVKFSSIDHWISISCSEGSMNILIPILHPITALKHKSPKGTRVELPDVVGSFSSIDWKRDTEALFEQTKCSQILSNTFAISLKLFMDDSSRVQFIHNLHGFERFSLVISYWSSFVFSSPPLPVLEVHACLSAYEKKFGFECAYLLSCLYTKCASSISGKLSSEFFISLSAISTSSQCILLRRLICIFSQPDNRLAAFDATFNEALKEHLAVDSKKAIIEEPRLEIRSVYITPSRVIFEAPRITQSNRLIRKYGGDRFLRVYFRDDDLQRLSVSNLEYDAQHIFDYFSSTLEKSLIILGVSFDFLAMSASQLRGHGCWFCRTDPNCTADSLRAWLGDFTQIKNVGKYAARLGQSLSASVLGLEEDVPYVLQGDIQRTECRLIDGKVETVEYTFSDGVGCISDRLADKIATNLRLKDTPSAFQIRYAGFKGVVARHPNPDAMAEIPLLLRESMKKFSSSYQKIDVLNFSTPIPCFINRQVIMILEGLGVPGVVFERLQTQDILKACKRFLSRSSFLSSIAFYPMPAESTFKRNEMKIAYEKDPFFKRLAFASHQRRLHDLLVKSRIFIPRGRILMGVIDETGTLQPDEVYIRCTMTDNYDIEKEFGYVEESRFVVCSDVIVAKNPCMHPGDVRRLRAVKNLQLERCMCDVIVFSQLGVRPIPNQCSGSDLDGDLYFVTWEPSLLPDTLEEALDYTLLAKQAVVAQSPISVSDVTNFMIAFMRNDSLGRIANAHVALVDQRPDGVRDATCRTLAEIFSLAVDFPKTGYVAQLPSGVNIYQWPDFMQKSVELSYESEKTLGVLFRQARQVIEQGANVFKRSRAVPDDSFLIEGYEEYLEVARAAYEEYKNGLLSVLTETGYSLENEAEILMMLDLSGDQDFRGEARLQLEIAFRRLSLFRQSIRDKFLKRHSKNLDGCLKETSAWYAIAYESEEQILSFPWILEDFLCEIFSKSASTASYETDCCRDLATEIVEYTLNLNADCKLAFSISDRYDFAHLLEAIFRKIVPDCSIFVIGSTACYLSTEKSNLNLLIYGFKPALDISAIDALLKQLLTDQMEIKNDTDLLQITGLFGSSQVIIIAGDTSCALLKQTIFVQSVIVEFPWIYPIIAYLNAFLRAIEPGRQICYTWIASVICEKILFLAKCDSPVTVDFLVDSSAATAISRFSKIEDQLTFSSDPLSSKIDTLGSLMISLIEEIAIDKDLWLDSQGFLSNAFLSILNVISVFSSAKDALEHVQRCKPISLLERVPVRTVRKFRLVRSYGKTVVPFVEGSSAFVFSNCESKTHVIRLAPLTGNRHSDRHRRICYVPVATSPLPTITSKIGFDDFYRACFRQLALFRAHFNPVIFGQEAVLRIKFGQVYFSSIPKLFLAEPLSCTVSSVQATLLKNYRAISSCAISSLTTLEPPSGHAHVPELTDQDATRKKSGAKRGNSVLKCSFSSFAENAQPFLEFLSQFSYNETEFRAFGLLIVAVSGCSEKESTIPIYCYLDEALKCVSISNAPLKWLQIDVAEGDKNLSDFRLMLTTQRTHSLEECKDAISASHLSLLYSGAAFRQSKPLTLNNAFLAKSLNQEASFVRRYETRIFEASEVTVSRIQRLSAEFEKIPPALLRLIRFKVSKIFEYSLLDPITGVYTLSTCHQEIELRLDFNAVSHLGTTMSHYDEIIRCVWEYSRLLQTIIRQ